ncbi:unnamed protein product [Nesidiocoris tenuis]|uniref:Thymidylate kinase n=2 Tax=Nesidiocoris tenuis TaxID=355587 RepID=A0A6H5GBP8_9HEMI|nr:Hypothetical protein NTJ_02258 [Nesidiocoris tenuis]CAA9999529.1 unnamed protein product [Nesidiocoris tenuis]CAA9999533.1 unnamed protein product [Nesidiocoris tenuis]
MTTPVGRGAFIVLEGCDRAGKSTQCRLLVEKLKDSNIPAELVVFPDRSTPIGQVISEYLKKEVQLPDQAIHLLFTANRWERAEEIKSKLEKGCTLIVDRYSYSGVAYSSAKEKKTSSFQWYKNPEEGLPKPDAVFYLNLEPEIIAERKGFGGERYESAQFQKDVAECFKKLNDGSWKIVDADKLIEDLTTELYSYVTEIVRLSKDKPLGVMW